MGYTEKLGYLKKNTVFYLEIGSDNDKIKYGAEIALFFYITKPISLHTKKASISRIIDNRTKNLCNQNEQSV